MDEFYLLRGVHGGPVEFIVPDPDVDMVAWKVRYFPSSGRHWWMKMRKDGFGRWILVSGFIPPAEDPNEIDDPDWYGGLA